MTFIPPSLTDLKQTLNRYALFIILFIFPTVSAIAKPHIEWAKYQLPPVFISQGEYEDQGMADEVFNFMQARLTAYSHSNYLSPGVRVMRDFKRKALICTALTNKKGREAFMLFSKPITVLPSHNLHYLANNPKLTTVLGKARVKGTISLEQLLAGSNSLIVGINTHRSFGDRLNDIVAHYKQQVEHLDETTSTAELITMLQTRRIDLTIELPFISYFVIRTTNNTAPIHIEPLLESAPFVKAYIACSNNNAGREVISGLNKIIDQHRDTKAYQKIYEDWIPQKSLSSFRAEFKRIVIEEQ